MKLRIMTYNVHACRGVDGRLDAARIAAVIAQAKPDIVALQELDVGRRRSGGVDQAHAIASRLDMAFHFNEAMAVEEELYGDAVLSALPMRLVKKGTLPGLARVRGLEPRGAVWVAIDLGRGRELQVINTHLGLVPLEQRLQAQCLAGREWIGAPDCAGPAILLGDFNATPRYAAYKTLASVLDDAQLLPRVGRSPPPPSPTFPSRLPVLRIDHLFVRDVEVLDMETPNGPLARAASDHLPLVAEIRV